MDWGEISKVVNELGEDGKFNHIGILNLNMKEIHEWKQLIPHANQTVLSLDHASSNATWEVLYPEWIDEEEEKRCEAADLAAAHKGTQPLHILLATTCFPVPNLFRCEELVTRRGSIWLYKPNLGRLRDKLRLPIGSCQLALPLGGIEEQPYSIPRKRRREAYATVLHSNYVYVCGAIPQVPALAQYYDKVIFIDSDLLVLRNIDFLFTMPELSATGNHEHMFNSGVMVIEPSNCTFQLLMDHVNDLESYNGGDQGYLNEVFTWWHRIPRWVNFLKHFWVGDDAVAKKKKNHMFESDPPGMYVLHYLGNKPWMCFRDYDCNWNVELLREFASYAAHALWWRKAQLQLDRREAEMGNFSDAHWRIRVKDVRLETCIDEDCDWLERLRHWGGNWKQDCRS
ncbi:hypothetical protein SASPL_115090 [Salvia splendens]|uniref:Hexosyltransferase n=1 Tax=Salvia splendens TaxID=180675 RepID=A0A8X8Y6V1_SALSN|nr:hypothetical protein SASPL_115090 [Salvia splendens]